jgi:hypothetical protein
MAGDEPLPERGDRVLELERRQVGMAFRELVRQRVRKDVALDVTGRRARRTSDTTSPATTKTTRTATTATVPITHLSLELGILNTPGS